MDINQALTIYVEHRQSDVTETTLESHKYRLGHFIRWCQDVADIDDVEDLQPADMHDYRVWRREDGDLSKVSEKTQMDTLRVFIRHLEKFDIVEEDLSEAVVSPTLDDGDNQSDDIVEDDTAERILEKLDRYHYATGRHAVFALAWGSSMRTSALRAIDLDDYDSEEQYIVVRNREEQGTRVKNGESGERHVALGATVCEVLDDYITEYRYDVEDEHGRDPLFTTQQGRISKTTIRNWVYRLTQPCFYQDSCPHDTSPEECRAADSTDYPYECPSSVAPHAIRRGSITYLLRNDAPKSVTSNRADVSERVLDLHYDARSEKEEMEQRRDHLPGF